MPNAPKMEFPWRYDYLIKIANMSMPYGKYKGMRLVDLPEPYIVWYHSKGFPKGELGELLAILYEVKLNGLEFLFTRLKK